MVQQFTYFIDYNLKGFGEEGNSKIMQGAESKRGLAY
jgi:hypothetical protein